MRRSHFQLVPSNTPWTIPVDVLIHSTVRLQVKVAFCIGRGVCPATAPEDVIFSRPNLCAVDLGDGHFVFVGFAFRVELALE